MSAPKKTLEAVLQGGSDANINFRDLRNLLFHLGFAERIAGSHHTFRRHGVRELINVQQEGGKAKAYQIRQIRRIIIENRLMDEL